MSDFTRYDTLTKYQFLLILLGLEKFTKGAEPYQEMYWVKRFRNYLVHFEPEWSDSTQDPKEEETKLESALRDRVEPNPKFDAADERFLPRLGLSFSSCEWALWSSLGFVKEFKDRIGDERVSPAEENALSIIS